MNQVYGEPAVTAGGGTVIPVTRYGPFGTARPVGVFLIHDGTVTWRPATDRTRIMLLGEVIGLVAATLATAAMVRRPPWPDLTPAALEALSRLRRGSRP